jgi:hypothetical protein
MVHVQKLNAQNITQTTGMEYVMIIVPLDLKT